VVAKDKKNHKSKVTTSFRIDPDLLETAHNICRKQSAQYNKDISLSLTLENLIKRWVEENRHYLSIK
jgi:hypothetical protein